MALVAHGYRRTTEDVAVPQAGLPGPVPVAFPEPTVIATKIDDIRYAGLPALIELKLASGLSSAGRLRDLADVQELIRALGLPDVCAEKLHPHVRVKFLELAAGVRESNEAETK